MNSGFYYLIKSKDIFMYFLKFSNFIKRNLQVFPAKVIAVYPSTMHVRLNMKIDRKDFFFSLNMKRLFFFFSWLKLNNLINTYYKIEEN